MLKKIVGLLKKVKTDDYEIVTEEVIREKRIIDSLWKAYSSAFEGQEKKYPHDQINYDETKFHEACTDPRILKCLFIYKDNLIGLALLVTPGNSKIAPWVSPQAYGDPNRLAYLSVLFLTPKYGNIGHGRAFCHLLMRDICPLFPNAVFGFDIAQGKRWFANLIKWEAWKIGRTIKFRGAQEYWIIT